MTIDKCTASQMWDRLKENLLGVQEALEDIIKNRAWEPLGYDSFADAWVDRLSDVKLSGVMQAAVVLAMFDQGETVEKVATTVSGVGPSRAKAYKQAHDAKLPPKLAERHVARMVPVKPYTRSMPKKRNRIMVEGFTDEEIREWTQLAHDLAVDRNELLREALRAGMKEWSGVRAVA